MREARSEIYFVTQNKDKFLEAARIAESFRINLRHLNLEKEEIQAKKLSEIASFAALQAAKTTSRSVVADDSGFFVRALHGFPGPYSSYVFDTIGFQGILKMMRGVTSRGAYFQAAVAYCGPRRRSICFTGIVNGTVAQRPKGSHGFGYDPIFIPSEGDGRTFAQMDIDEKNLFSHRARAFKAFCRWMARASH